MQQEKYTNKRKMVVQTSPDEQGKPMDRLKWERRRCSRKRMDEMVSESENYSKLKWNGKQWFEQWNTIVFSSSFFSALKRKWMSPDSTMSEETDEERARAQKSIYTWRKCTCFLFWHESTFSKILNFLPAPLLLLRFFFRQPGRSNKHWKQCQKQKTKLFQFVTNSDSFCASLEFSMLSRVLFLPFSSCFFSSFLCVFRWNETIWCRKKNEQAHKRQTKREKSSFHLTKQCNS